MRVLMLGTDRTWFGAEYSGDVVKRHQEYVKRLGGRLDIIVFTTKRFREREISNNLHVYPTNSLTKLNYVLDAFWLAKNIQWPHGFDLTVTQDPFLSGLVGWLVKKKFKAPLLIHFHGDFWQNKYWLFNKKRWWFNWFFWLISKFIISDADGIRVVSSGIKEKLIKSGIDEKKIKVIPTPVDVEKFKRFDISKIRSIQRELGDKKAIINVGRKDPSKDYKTLRKTVELAREKYRNLAFVQIGDSGKIRQEDLINYYYASSVYVSSSCHESFGKVLVEAMACGLPVVATATTGSQEIVANGETGFLVPVGDSRALAQRIIYLLNNPDRAREMGKNGRKAVSERFNQQKTIGNVVQFWRDLQK